MQGTGRTLLVIVLILLLAAFGLQVLEGIGYVLLAILIILLVPVALVAFWVWRVKRRMRKGLRDLERIMQQAAAARGPPRAPGAPPQGQDVIDVEPTSVKDEPPARR